jgi:hypothetical protein
MTEAAPIVTASSPPQARALPARQGLAWWTETWRLFTGRPGLWLGFVCIEWLVLMVCGMVPFLGSAAAAVATQVIAGGWLLALRKHARGETLDVSDLFSAWAASWKPLAILGIACFAVEGSLWMALNHYGYGATDDLPRIDEHIDLSAIAAALQPFLLKLLVAVVVAMFVSAALYSLLWFVVPGIVLDGRPIGESLRTGLRALVRNVPAFLVFDGLALLALLAMTGLGWLAVAALGWFAAPLIGLALLPVALLGAALGHLSVYVTWRDVFDRAS